MTAPAAEPDAEVSFVQRDLAAVLPRVKIAGAAADRRGAASACAKPRTGAARDAKPLPVAGIGPAGAWLAYAAEGNPDPYAGFEARIVPENITLLPKTTQQTTGGNSWNERTIMREEGRQHLQPSCAISAPRRTRSRPSPPRSACAAATAA